VAVPTVSLFFGVLTGMAFLTRTGVSFPTGVEIAGRSVMDDEGATGTSLF
jgi:hypothetical protein